jgi:hypothetical protein
VVHAGGTHSSYNKGAESLHELAEWNLKVTRVAELTHQSGQEMKQQQTARVEAHFQREAQRPLTVPRGVAPEAPPNPPQVGVVEMDGGRIRTRDEGGARGVKHPHWREFQAGCVVRLQSEVSAVDPRPEVPRLFLTRPQVHQLVSQLHRQRRAAAEDPAEEPSIGELLAEERLVENAAQRPAEAAASSGAEPSSEAKDKRPVRLMRTCVATQEGADACGRIVAAEAARRGFDQAPRKAFLGDGQTCNWTVWKRYFKPQGYLPIVDFIHLLSYVYTLAMTVGRTADEGWQYHVKWVTALWEGRAEEVLAAWRSLAEPLQIPPDKALPEDDPRRPVQRGLTYLTNNLSRTDYPRYRRLGLPVTSTLMESLVKEFNQRVKGTEKFWNDPEGAEVILTVRAALLSEDDRFNEFFATRPGCRYRRRSTTPQPPPAMDATVSAA